MPWYQPSEISPPPASIFQIRNENYTQNDGEELEFGQEASSSENNNNESGNFNPINDPLIHRLSALFSPMVPSHLSTSSSTAASSTSTVTHHPPAPLPPIVSGPLGSLLQRSMAIDNSKLSPHGQDRTTMMFSPYPHPSFPHRESPIPSHLWRENEETQFFYPRQRMFSTTEHGQTNQFDQEEDLVGRGVRNNADEVQSDPVVQRLRHEDEQFRPQNYHHQTTEQIWNTSQRNRNKLEDPAPLPNHGYGFDYINYDPDQNSKTRKRMKQTSLIGNNNSTTTNDLHNNSQNNNGSSWAHVGQIGTYHENNNSPEGQEVMNDQSRTKKKDKKKKKKKRERPLPDLRAMFSPQTQASTEIERNVNTDDLEERGSQGSNDHKTDCKDDGDNFVQNNVDDDFEVIQTKVQEEKKPRSKAKKRSREKRKKNDAPTLSSEELTSQSYQIEEHVLREFAEHYDVKNAGANDESLAMFLQLVKNQGHVAWSTVFYDRTCSTPFISSTKKYCTPKGPPCINWNCTCDNQIRAIQATAPLVGAMFVFPMDETKTENLDCFLLPLGPTTDPVDGPKDIDEGYERMANWPFLPILCDTTLQQRWDALRSIFMHRHLVCATYNVPLGVMPYHYHCINDLGITRSASGGGYDIDLLIPGLWDLRLASWMLAPHSTEEDLEFEKKRSGFPHLWPKQKDPPNGASEQMLGLIKAKNQLEFLYVLFPIVGKLLEKNGLKAAFDEIESPVQSILSSMECNGIGFKADRLVKIQSGIESRVEALTAEARGIAKNNALMLSSPQQVSQLLYVKMGITMPSKLSRKAETNTQHQSTSEEALKAIQIEFKSKNSGEGLRIIDIILEFRGLSKMLNTYIRPYPQLARTDNGRVHTRRSRRRSKKAINTKTENLKIFPMWMQTAVRTGRLSCRKPNMQQIPTGSVLGVCPRNAFTSSSKETCLFAFDYSQNEVRILAHMSNDEALLSLFLQPGQKDIYKQMSSVTNGKAVDLITDKERAVSKQVTLAIMYGMGLPQVAKQLDVNRSTAKAFFDSFFGRFQGVKKWMDDTKEFARRNKYVKTISGRRRYLDNINSTDNNLKTQAERQAVNSIIQGSAADLMKLAMLKMASRLMDWRKEGSVGGSTGVAPRMLLQIHDELVLELMANEADVKRLEATVHRCCSEECAQEFRLKLPLKLKCSVGSSWGNMKEI